MDGGCFRMLIARKNSRFDAPRPDQQRGVVLFISLIILIAMTLAGIALIRSTDLANIIAGNLAFKQAATHAGDRGVEEGFVWLQNNTALLLSDVPSAGYSANGKDATRSPAAGQSWESYWASLPSSRIRSLTAAQSGNTGNTVSFIVDRMCALSGDPSGGANCTASTVAGVSGGGGEEGGEVGLTASSAIYYRITVRIAGPRNTVSFVQAMVTL